MHESLAFTNFLNHVFGAPVSGLLQKIGFHEAVPGVSSPLGFNTAAPFNDNFALELAVVLVLIGFFLIVRLTLNVEKPGPAQFMAETIHDFVGGQADQIIGHGYERYQPFVASIFLFVLLSPLPVFDIFGSKPNSALLSLRENQNPRSTACLFTG